jgi:hypothetical protein
MIFRNPIRMTAFVSTATRQVKLKLFHIFATFSFWLPTLLAQAGDFGIHPDFKMSFNGRTYPVGAQIAVLPGASKLLWGDSNDWKYGYVRLGLNLYTSAVVNRAGVEFQVFPISILGISAGYDSGTRNFIPRWLDCGLYACTGRVDRRYVRLNLFGAVKKVSFSLMAKFEELKGFQTVDKPLFDEMSLLAVRMTGENTITYSPAVLYRLDEETQVGFASLYARSLTTPGYSHLYGPVVNWNPEPKLNALMGFGLNSGPVAHSALCGFFMISYNFLPSMAVTDLALRKTSPGVSGSPD